MHTDEGSALHRDRLILTRRRKVAAALRPPKPAKEFEDKQGWLKEFSFERGYGFITPIKLDKGGRMRKQRLFFHKNDWVGSPALTSDNYKFPLRVRYVRVAPEDVRKGWRAARVSATGPRATPVSARCNNAAGGGRDDGKGSRRWSAGDVGDGGRRPQESSCDANGGGNGAPAAMPVPQ